MAFVQEITVNGEMYPVIAGTPEEARLILKEVLDVGSQPQEK